MDADEIKKIIVPIFWIYIGIVFYSLSTNISSGYGRSFLFMLNALSGGFGVYGFICFIANVRVGKSTKGIKKEIKKNLSNAFNKINNDGRNN
tara:strand:- start:2722 stop:2997 length:276 start_codon:yes stop_codon:yes gene_type:complete